MYIGYTRERKYLVVLKNKAETSRNRLEGTEGVRSVSDPTEEQLSRGGHSGLPVRFFLVCDSTWLGADFGVKIFHGVVRNGSGVYVVQGKG